MVLLAHGWLTIQRRDKEIDMQLLCLTGVESSATRPVTTTHGATGNYHVITFVNLEISLEYALKQARCLVRACL